MNKYFWHVCKKLKKFPCKLYLNQIYSYSIINNHIRLFKVNSIFLFLFSCNKFYFDGKELKSKQTFNYLHS